MSLPFMILVLEELAPQAWQPEEAEDLVAAAASDLLDNRYRACREKCVLALSYENTSVNLKLAAHIQLGLALEDPEGIQAARIKATALISRVGLAIASDLPHDDRAWFEYCHQAIQDLKTIEDLCAQAQSEQRFPLSLPLLSEKVDRSIMLSKLSDSRKLKEVQRGGAEMLRRDAVARWTGTTRDRMKVDNELMTRNRVVGTDVDPFLVDAGIASMI